MATHHYLISLPVFNEFVFFCMKNASPEQKARLNPMELRPFHTVRKMRDFADNESTERKLLLLARLGRSFAVMIHSDKTELEEVFDGVDTQYHYAGKRAKVIKLMQEQECFFFGSREAMMSAHMAAQNSHSGTFVLDSSYFKLHQKFADIYEFGSDQVAMRRSLDTMDDMAKMALGTLNAHDVVKSLTGMNDYEMRILLACMPHRNSFVSLDTIKAAVYESARSQGIKQICFGLAKRGYLSEMKGKEEKARTWNFTIMEKGIDAVAVYLKYIHKKTF